ncbi:MAG: hypothetical protein ACXVCY_15290 [Pseudobdellovibrionaceae bacterium]
MILVKKVILLIFLGPLAAWASLNLPEPAEMLNKARGGQSALRDVILDLEFNISELRDPVTFNKYFFILDELQSLAKSSDLEKYYPQIVEKLGLNMVSNGLRWLDVTQDSPEKLGYYIKWMDGDILARFQGVIEYQISMIKDPMSLMNMANTLEVLLPQIDQKTANLPYVQIGFRHLISDAAVALLKKEGVSEDQISVLIKKLIISSSLSEYLNHLNKSLYTLKNEDKIKGHLYISRLHQLYIQAGKLSDGPPPNWLLNDIGDSLCQILLLMVRYEEVVSLEEMSLILKDLSLRRLEGLAQQWMAEDINFSPNYMDQFLKLSRALIKSLETAGLKKDAEDLSKWLSQKAAPIMAQKINIEGFYELRNDKGEVWYFTIVFARKDYLVASLASIKGDVYKNFYNVIFSTLDNCFVASEREQNAEIQQNPPIKFWINEKEEIKILDLFSRNGSPILAGHKIQNFDNLSQNIQSNPPPADGVFQGTLVLPDGHKIQVKLIVTLFEGYSLGRIDAENLTVDFNIGSKGTDGTLLLTSGRSTGSWMQIRAIVTTDGLKARVIIGGRGQSETISILKRIN